MNTIIGAFIATVIAVATAALALLSGPEITSLSDISGLQWTILLIGGAITFGKDFQAISARRLVNKVTGSGDGGGTVG
ncbi:MAG: hypothetical protein KAJ19_28775 [Gammaproteobacteria bacterium]|nr:hypothetical protein [Gammaproteobacteria bacterium]